jgi:hypothetical protein
VLTGDGPRWWWWAVLALSGLGVVVAGVWTFVVQKQVDEKMVHHETAKTFNQTAGDGGTNVSVSADNNSVAAWHVDTLNMGQRSTDERGS